MALDGFLAGLPAGVQLFSLFEAEPAAGRSDRRHRRDLAGACALPVAQRGRARRGDRRQLLGAPGRARQALTRRADRAAGSGGATTRRSLDAARRWMKEWHFRIGVHHLRGLIDGFEAGKRSMPILPRPWCARSGPWWRREFARQHGPHAGARRGGGRHGQPGRGAAERGLGPRPDRDLRCRRGWRPRTGRVRLRRGPTIARLTQALVTALTAPMAEGRLYEVDMRLRPSGRQGPVATSLRRFPRLSADRGLDLGASGADPRAARWPAIRRCGTRSRPSAASLLAAKGQGAAVLPDVAAMRARLHAARPARAAWEAKNGPGRLMDIELAGTDRRTRRRPRPSGVRTRSSTRVLQVAS